MKTNLFILLLFSSLLSVGQISITSADMPVAGDTLRYSIAAPDTLFLNSYLGSGPSYSWNFSYLQPMAQGVETHKFSSQTSYNFPNSIAKLFADTLDMGGTELTDIYEFRKMDSSKISMVGRGITADLGIKIPISVPYLDTGVVYEFPLNYNDRDSNYFIAQYVQPFFGAYYQAAGYRINEVDGFGQITTPFGVFNCIRVVTDVIESDTVRYDTTGIRVDLHLREYKWLAKGEKYPILQVTGAVDSGIFVPALITYRDSTRVIVNLDEQRQSSQFAIFPNPSSGGEVNIQFQQLPQSSFQIELLDLSGRLIRHYDSHSLRVTGADVLRLTLPTELRNGIYFLKIDSRDSSFTSKLIIHKN